MQAASIPRTHTNGAIPVAGLPLAQPHPAAPGARWQYRSGVNGTGASSGSTGTSHENVSEATVAPYRTSSVTSRRSGSRSGGGRQASRSSA
jgi:hypothetical protein